jgi:hypothetical protein
VADFKPVGALAAILDLNALDARLERGDSPDSAVTRSLIAEVQYRRRDAESDLRFAQALIAKTTSLERRLAFFRRAVRNRGMLEALKYDDDARLRFQRKQKAATRRG